MQTFVCEFDDEGVTRRSTLEAKSADEAVSRLRNMGMDVRRIGTSNENLEPVSRPSSAVSDPEPERITIAVEAEEDLPEDDMPIDDQGLFENPMAVPHPTLNPTPVVPPPAHVPPTMGDKKHFQSIIESDSPPDDPEPQKEEVGFINVRRRHSLLVGTHEELRPRLDPLLSQDGYGKIVDLVMHPDMKGKMILAVVVEHDEKVD
jgi:hypothetical protein